MQLDWTPPLRERLDDARRFAEQRLAPCRGADGFDREAWTACGREGVFATPLPAAWGGRGEGALTTVGLLEALGRGGADRGLLFALGAHLFGCAVTIARFGSQRQHDRFGQGLADGSLVAALAATEPEGGSSASRMATIAESCPDGYLLRGVKTLVTNGPVADLFLVIAATAPRRGAWGLAAFLLPRATDGLEIEPLTTVQGMRGAPMAKVTFRDCRVSSDALLGRPGGGLAVLCASMQWERTCILAGFLGAAERDLAAAVAHARERRDEHGPLFNHQAVSHRLARMKYRLEAARWLLYRGAWALDHGQDPLLAPAMVKLVLSETLVECAMDVLRTFAGAGWLDEQGTATALRDVVGTLSASGTNDVQLNLIASCLGDSAHVPSASVRQGVSA